MEFSIRPAQENDLHSVYRLICRLEETEFDYSVFRKIYKDNLRNNSCIYLIAETGAEPVVGFASLHIQSLLHHCGNVAELQELFVSREHRRMGIGKGLLQAAEQKALEYPCAIFEVTANCKRHKAHSFYMAYGLKCTHKKFVKSFV